MHDLKTLGQHPRKPSDYGKVGVLMGGESAEREVSLMSGKAVLDALLKAGIDAHAVDVHHSTLINVLQQQNFDLLFNALQGPGGEDGQIQALLDFLKIPYTGSGMESSAISMNKNITKNIWLALGLPVLPGQCLDPDFDPEQIVAQYGLPLAVKPICEGSTIGITRVDDISQLLPAYQEAAKYGKGVLIEPWVTGEEYTVGIVGEDVLPSIKIIPASEYYDYHAKYIANDTQYLLPSGLTDQEEKSLQNMCLKAYHAVGCEGCARLDLIRDKQGHFWLFEINTIPGLTDHSLVPKMVYSLGLSFIDLILGIMESALVRRHMWERCA